MLRADAACVLVALAEVLFSGSTSLVEDDDLGRRLERPLATARLLVVSLRQGRPEDTGIVYLSPCSPSIVRTNFNMEKI